MRRGATGFTLVELIVSIVIIGILFGAVAVFMRGPIEGYFDTVRRALLTDAADTTARRIARDIHAALPNSLRGPSPASAQCVEFLPVVAGGRYRVNAGTGAGPFDSLNFTAADTSFDVLAHTGLDTISGAHYVAIYNLGILGANAYAGDTTAAYAAAGSTTSITITGKKFPFESPGKRFHVIPNYSVVYSCAGGNLTRSTRDQSLWATPMGSCPSAGTILVANATCSFAYEAALNGRQGLLALTLDLNASDSSGEKVRLYQEVHVDNVP